MAEGSSRHLDRCGTSASRSPFKSEFCQQCESKTTQLCYEIKHERNFCFKCQNFTETDDYRIKPEIYFCQDCRVLMKITSYETECICHICHLVKENKNYTPKKDSSQAISQKAPTTKDYYLQKIYKELICGFTLDHIQRKQVKTMFNALVEFIESQNIYIPLKRLNYKFFISKILDLLFPSEKNKTNELKKSNALGQFSGIS